MKKGISLLGVISGIAFMFVLAFIPMRAQAATLKTYKEGSVVLLKSEGKYLYEFTLEEDSLINIDYAYNSALDGELHFYEDMQMERYMTYVFLTKESGNEQFVLNKGTYYISMYDNANTTTKVKIVATPAKTFDKGNYCASEAQSLAARKWVKFASTRDYEYTRWYSIKTTKTQKITIDMPAGSYYYLTVINAKNGKQYQMHYDNSRTITTLNRVPAGNYYITVHFVGMLQKLSGPESPFGMYYQFRWY